MNIELDAKIEALLFSKAEPITVAEIARILKEPEHAIRESITALEAIFARRGVRILRHEDTITLTTAPECATFLDEIRREDLSKDLSKASLETLSVILYTDNPTRGDIDYIRGVNSSFILRNLLVRGMVEKDIHPSDSRKLIYKPSLDLLRFLGITQVGELSNFSETKEKLTNFKAGANKQDE